MAEGCLITKWESVSSLENLSPIGIFSVKLATMYRRAEPIVKKGLMKKARRMGANIVVIRHEPMHGEHREYSASGEYYKLLD